MKKPRIQSLQKASFDEICEMPCDSVDCKDFTLMTNGTTVWITEQKSGEQLTQRLTISRSVFNALVREYQKPRKLK